MSNISFWLNNCQSDHAYKTLSDYGYEHNWILHGDIGGIHARISGKYFEPDEDGDFFIAQPVWESQPCLYNYVEEPILYDIIAWHPSKPGDWYFYRGETGLILNEWELLESSLYKEPVKLHSTPFAWLQSGCEGSVLLDHHGLSKLYGLSEVVCEDIEHGTRLEKGLSMYYRANLPHLTVPALQENIV